MGKTKYWLSILAISVVLIAGSLAVGPIAFAGDDEDDDDVEASIEAELELEQGDSVDVEVKAKGLKPNVTFVVRAYGSDNCSAPPLGGTTVGSDTSDDKGKIKISGPAAAVSVDAVNSVSIRDPGSPGKIVVCFQDTTP